MAENGSKGQYITYRAFNAAVFSILGVIVVGGIYVSQGITSALEAHKADLEKQLESHKADLRERLDRDIIASQERYERAMDSLRVTRNTALTSLNARLDQAVSGMTMQLQEIRATNAMLMSEITSLSRGALTQEMIERIISKSINPDKIRADSD